MHATPPHGGWPRRRGGQAILANAILPIEDSVRWTPCLGPLVIATTLGGNIAHIAPPQWQTTVGTHFEQLSSKKRKQKQSAKATMMPKGTNLEAKACAPWI
jgi:hypothetical protein